MGRADGKTALVTGAPSGIGRGCALAPATLKGGGRRISRLRRVAVCHRQ